MPKTKIIAMPVKEAIVRAKEGAQTVRAVANLFNISPGTVSKICKRKKQMGALNRLEKSGRPHKTSEWLTEQSTGRSKRTQI
jgi:transposase